MDISREKFLKDEISRLKRIMRNIKNIKGKEKEYRKLRYLKRSYEDELK